MSVTCSGFSGSLGEFISSSFPFSDDQIRSRQIVLFPILGRSNTFAAKNVDPNQMTAADFSSLGALRREPTWPPNGRTVEVDSAGYPHVLFEEVRTMNTVGGRMGAWCASG